MQIIHFQDIHHNRQVFEATIDELVARHQESDLVFLEKPLGRPVPGPAIDTAGVLDLFDEGSILLPRALLMHKGLEGCMFYGVEDPDLYEERRKYAEQVISLLKRWYPNGEENDSYILEYAAMHDKDPDRIKGAVARWGKHYLGLEKRMLPQVDRRIVENAVGLMESHEKDYAFLVLGMAHEGIKDSCKSLGIRYETPLKGLVETLPGPTQEAMTRFLRHFS